MGQKRRVCVLLPNKQHVDCTVGVRSRGHEVLKCILQQLAVADLQVFGLSVLRDNELLFLDLDLKLRKYFGKAWSRGSPMVQFVLFLKVRHHVESGLLLFSSKVQQLYYAELRQKVLQSQSRHQEALLFQLAASALQAEVGDLGASDGGEQCFLPEDYFPSWMIKRRGRDFLLRHGPTLHAELKGLTRRQALLQFVKEANGLQDAAAVFYRMRQEKKEQRGSVLLGVSLRGVQVYQEVEGKLCLLYDLSWTQIDRLTFQGCRFEISAVGSLCLPKLQYFTPSAFHSRHILKQLTESHRFHISTRDSLSYVQHLEDLQAGRLYKEAYICDTEHLKQRLQHCSRLSSSLSDCSVTAETRETWCEEEEEEEEEVIYAELEMCVDDPEEVLVDDPAEESWLAEESVDAPSEPSSDHWAAVTSEMKQVLRRRADDGVSVD